MDILRRTVLKGATASGVLATALAAGLLKPTQVLAAPRSAFEAKNLADAMKGMGALVVERVAGVRLDGEDLHAPGVDEIYAYGLRNPFSYTARWILFSFPAMPGKVNLTT